MAAGDSPTGVIAGRPLLVWVIFLLTVVGALANTASLWVVATGNVQLPPEQQAYVASRGALAGC